ncbi:NAD-dependent epimerase/dehydratase family protein [Haloarculaceae archaeon H-GB1-1]|nr:NAD-dependent epimerase/dehydratase family protein [Haloarculaceae archaeon H-GB1-1]
MPDHALVIGGTRFIGRHTVEELLAHDYEVTLFNRGKHPNPFEGDASVSHVQGDRTDDGDLADAAAVDPDVVIDCVAYYPREVRTATRAFADVDAYVFVSSEAAYQYVEIPEREDETPLRPCSEEQATDDSSGTYGQRKAEGDRAVFAAAERGVNAMSVRPSVVYGPHDYSERIDYWIERAREGERVLVPGDGMYLKHLAYVENVAQALRLVAEGGTPGEAYNVGDRTVLTLQQLVETLADVLDSDVEVVTADEHALAASGLAPTDFPIYASDPHVMDTCKLDALGYDPVPTKTALATTVDDHLETDGDEPVELGPSREETERVLGVLETM